jgi:methylisocitrate lyase
MPEVISPGRALREAVAQGPMQVPGAPFALAARLIERAGFPAAYLSGAAFSTGILGLPDVGLFTLTELAQHTRYLTQSVNIPLIVDADTGFGEAIHTERTVAELEAAGAAAIQLEDQVLPKRCGHLSGKAVVETDAMCAKLKAAISAREDDDTVILARTDARGVLGMDEAIERAKRYVASGADWIFPEALTDKAEFERFAKQVDVPLVANMTEFGKSPLLSFQELAELGYSAVLYPASLLRIAMRAMEASLAVLITEGTQASLVDLMQTREELYDLLDYDDYDQRDREFFGGPGGLA